MFAPGTSSVLTSTSAPIFFTAVLLSEFDDRLQIQTTDAAKLIGFLNDGIHQLDQPALGTERELRVRAEARKILGVPAVLDQKLRPSAMTPRTALYLHSVTLISLMGGSVTHQPK